MSKTICIIQAELKRILHYDPKTGIWVWVACGKPQYNGKRADAIFGDGRSYRTVSINRKKYYSHRLAWLYMRGEWPQSDIDHRDTDKGNNAWDNLRLATDSQNNANKAPKPRLLPKGVDLIKRNLAAPYQARIKVNHRNVHLGLFSTPEEAHAAYVAAAQKHFGEYARTA